LLIMTTHSLIMTTELASASRSLVTILRFLGGLAVGSATTSVKVARAVAVSNEGTFQNNA